MWFQKKLFIYLSGATQWTKILAQLRNTFFLPLKNYLS